MKSKWNFNVNLDLSTLKQIKNIIIISLSVVLIMTIILLAGPSVETQSQPTVYDLDKKNAELAKLYAGNQNTLENTPSLYLNSTQDTQPPVTTINKVLDDDKSEVAIGPNATISSDYFKIEFSAVDNKKVDRFECSLDAENFMSCKSPMIVYRDNANLTQTKTIEIRAVDNSSNVEGQPAIFLYKFKQQ